MTVKEIYNEKNKKAFLNENYKSEKTKEQYEILFKKSSINESIFEEDLYDFDLNQIADTIYGMNLSQYSARQAVTVFRNYIDWAIKNNLAKKNTNRLREISGSEYLSSLFDSSKVLLLHIDEVTRFEDEIFNSYREAVISRLIFEGAWGKGGSEIINIKNNSEFIDADQNKLKLVDDNGEVRYIKVSDRLLELARKAENENIIKGSSGREYPLYKYEDRLIKLNRENTLPSQTSTFLNREISAHYKEEGYKQFKRQTLRLSGMLYMAKNLLDRDGELKRPQWKEIADQFGISELESGLANARISDFKTVINEERIQEIYG
ncbi:hypothetical protein ACI2JA_03785 [Alkalihalobacillus sp. NPDC078783]